MIIRKPDGKTVYYYYKKKVGRHRKPGPKPKKIKKIRIPIVWNYKIIITSNRKQIAYVNTYPSLEKAIDAFNDIKNTNNEIIFPVKFLNSKIMKKANYEILLLERNLDNKPSNKLHNSYGKLVDNIIINNNKWIIYDKAEKLVEETFWVYGYHPNLQRKNFMWIFNNLLLNNITEYSDILRIILFKNKVIIKKDNNDIELVICKNESDSIRLYNLLEEYCKKYKIKQIFFIGSANKISNFRKIIINDIMAKTNWNLKKINRSSTRP